MSHVWKRIAFAHVIVPLSVLHAIPPVRDALDRLAQGWRPEGWRVDAVMVSETGISVTLEMEKTG